MPKPKFPWGKNLLTAFVCFITFIVLFESYLELSNWVQVIGRMHPLVLHFPIVLVLIAIIFEWNKTKFKNSNIPITHFLWVITALLSGLTVIMGIFLSQEDGYDGNTLNWHKWSGIAVFYLAAIFAWKGDSFSGVISKVLLPITGLTLLASGHWGAELTHGENFILGPILSDKKERKPLEEALVFDDLVLPILDAKCNSCHNTEKAKGGLALLDSLLISKGGKNGDLFNFENPSQSLFLERIHLPLEDKKHMPPKGKPQLTDLEQAILLQWIKNKTPYSDQIVSLTPTDTLRILAEKVWSSATVAQPKSYTFKATDTEVISNLNNDYRTVIQLAANSPALAVNIFNAQEYQSSQLSELDKIQKQIVHLDLSRLPVTDDDLKKIISFENLEKLNLNFTNITGKGLEILKNLKNLEQLYLAGTPVSKSDLSNLLASSKSLKHVTVWDTKVTSTDLAELKGEYPNLQVIRNASDLETVQIKLNIPSLKTKQWVFNTDTEIELTHPIKGVSIHYTLDGSEPDSTSDLYSQPIKVNASQIVRLKGYKEGWIASDISTFNVYKNTFKPDSVQLLNKLNHVHLAEGAHTFFDGQLGAIGANNPAWANHFAGVRHDDLQLVCRFKEPISPNTITIRHMIEEETSIYPPDLIEIWGGMEEGKLQLISKKVITQAPESRARPTLENIHLPIKPGKYAIIKVVASPWFKPGEHNRLLLIDEMFIN